MVERLKDEPFALLGINSDGDRDVSNKLEAEDKNAVAGLGLADRQAFDVIRRGDAAVLAKLGARAEHVRKAVFQADLENLRSILEKQSISWRQAVEGSTHGALPTKWNVSSWPTIYILDATGRIRFKNLRNEDLEQAVVQLIAEAKEKDPR